MIPEKIEKTKGYDP